MTTTKLLLFEENEFNNEVQFVKIGNIQDAIYLYDTNNVFLSLSNYDHLISKIEQQCEENGLDLDLPYSLEDYIQYIIDGEGVEAPRVLFEQFKDYGIDLDDVGETIWVDDQQREIISMSAEEGVYQYNKNITLYTERVDDLDEEHLKVLYRDDRSLFEDIIKEYYDNLGFTDDDIDVILELDYLEEAIDKVNSIYDKNTLKQVGIVEIDEDIYNETDNRSCEYYGKYYMVD